jgi:apolipoprotein N-acyltransferase
MPGSEKIPSPFKSPVVHRAKAYYTPPDIHSAGGSIVDHGAWAERWGDELFAGMASGFLLALSFPPFPTRFLAAVALVPLLRYYIVRFAERGAGRGRGADHSSAGVTATPGCVKRSLVLGFALGATFFVTLLFWILDLIPESGVTMHWVLFPGLVLLVLYLSCYTMLFTLALSTVVRRLGTIGVFAAPALWSLAELARSHGELGFSWGVLANALAVYPVALQGLAVYGPFGLSFVLALLNVLSAFALFAPSPRRRVWYLVAFIAIAGGHLLWGRAEIARFDADHVERGEPNEVAVVQPNVDLGLKWQEAYRDSLFIQMEAFTILTAREGAKLVIFPETAAPVSFKATPRYLEWLERMASDNRIDILTGFIDHTLVRGEWQTQNAAALIDHRGTLAGVYHKVNLLPFGEKIPWSQYLPLLSRANFGQANFVAGTEQTLFGSSVGKFGVLICFESTFPLFTRRYVRDGADFLVNITNDGWFGSSRGPIQHAEMAILRAVENRVTLFRSAYTGVSMVVDPVGRVGRRLGLFRTGVIYGTVERAVNRSVYTRFGDAICWIMIAANLLLVYAYWVRDGGARRRVARRPHER